jgi:hypothetical protein
MTSTKQSESLRHLYIYNECYETVTVTVEYVPLGENYTDYSTKRVSPGHQVLLCVTEEDSVVMLGAVTDDARFVWIREEINFRRYEHTHVLNCGCKSNCPGEWPQSTSRSYPIEYNKKVCVESAKLAASGCHNEGEGLPP